MGWEHKNGQMVQHIRDNGKIIISKAKENILGQMDEHTKVLG